MAALALAGLAAGAVAAEDRGDAEARLEKEERSSQGPERCELEVDLMAVVYDAEEPQASFAMLKHGRGGGRLVGVGTWVRGMPVRAIEPRAVWLGAGDDLCWIRLRHEGNPPPKASKKKRRRKKRR